MKSRMLSSLSLCTLALAAGIASSQDTPNRKLLGVTKVEGGGYALNYELGTPAHLREPPKWSDDEMQRLGTMLSGSWKATVSTPSGAHEMVISAAPVHVSGMTDTLYVEAARADGLNRPYRAVIWQIHRMKGDLRLKTLEFRRPRGEMPQLVGMWAAPTTFPVFSMQDLVTTLDIALTADGNGWKGQTPAPYPTAVAGAVEMTSQIAISADELRTADRGFDASGAKVWGPEEGQFYVFKRFDSGVKVNTWEGGLTTIDFPATLTGDPAKEGDMVTLHYVGYLENGEIFDTSYERGQPFQYSIGQRLIAGWNTAMTDMQAGLQRRLIVPGPLAYGEAGRRPKIPSNATLIFDIDVMKVAPGQAVPPLPTPPPQPAAGDVKVNTNQQIQQAEPPPEIRAKMEEEMARRRAERIRAMEEAAKKEAEQKGDGKPK
jgi:hypothetical protein